MIELTFGELKRVISRILSSLKFFSFFSKKILKISLFLMKNEKGSKIRKIQLCEWNLMRIPLNSRNSNEWTYLERFFEFYGKITFLNKITWKFSELKKNQSGRKWKKFRLNSEDFNLYQNLGFLDKSFFCDALGPKTVVHYSPFKFHERKGLDQTTFFEIKDNHPWILI